MKFYNTSYKISSELLHFLVSRDLLNSQENNEYHFSSILFSGDQI